MRFKNKEAVSPVIGVILMVAITVILAAVVYLWVVGFMPTGKGTPAVGATTSKFDKGVIVTINSVTGGGITSITVKGLKYVLVDSGGNIKDSGNVEDIYGTYSKLAGDKEGVKFQDNTYSVGTSPGAMAAGDVFYIKDNAPGHGGVVSFGAKLTLIYTSTNSEICSFILT